MVDAVLRAALEVFARGGWDAFQVDAVAERAGVHKTTIYRRWPTRGTLLGAALVATPFRPGGASVPDTGTAAGDLRAIAADLEHVLRVPRTRRIIRGLAAATADPEVAAAYGAFFAVRLDVIGTVLRRGIERGELPPASDPDLIATIFMGAIRFQVIDLGVDPPPSWFDDLVTAVVKAAS